MTIHHLCRFAWLQPRIEWTSHGHDDSLTAWAGEILRAELTRATRCHPDLSVLEPAPPLDADLAALWFGDRRDAVGWVELTERGSTLRVRLELRRLGQPDRAYDALASNDIGAAITAACGQWLADDGLAPLPTAVSSFALADLLACATEVMAHHGQVMAERSERQAAHQRGEELPLPVAPIPAAQVLGVAACRVAQQLYSAQVDARVHELDADDIELRLQAAVDARDLDAVKAIAATAPGWVKPWRAAVGLTEDKDEEMYFATEALARAPRTSGVVHTAGNALLARYRRSDGFRLYDRASELDPNDLAAHSRAVGALHDMGRTGAAYDDVLARFDRFPDSFRNDAGAGLFGAHPDMVWCRLRFANVLWSIGRVDEAINVRERAVASAFGNWSNQTKVLDDWREGIAPRVHAYAREGYFRGDVGRAVAGAAAAPIDKTAVLTAFLTGLVETGQADLAMLAWHQHRSLPAGRGVTGDLVAARAMIETGETAELPFVVMSAGLRGAQSEHGPAVNRILRAAACVGAAPWAEAVEREQARGAVSLARRLARDAADFAPDASAFPVIASTAVSATASIAVDQAWFEPLRAELGAAVTEPIDAWMRVWTDPNLAAADRAVVGWTEVVAAPEPGTGPEAANRYMCELVYLLARTAVDYLASTTAAPSPRAGALRTIADDALSALNWWRGRFSTKTLSALMTAFEPVASLPAWLVDPWLLRIERTLRLDEHLGGHFELITGAAPTVAALLRGPERVSAELSLAASLLESEPARAEALYDRCTRAIGGNIAPKWSTAAEAAGLPADRALDIHLAATFAHPYSAGSAVRAARLLLARGHDSDGAAALSLLVSRLGFAGAKWRADTIAELQPLLDAHLPVPVGADAAQTAGYEAMQAGRMADAIAPYQWCDALEPGIEMCLKNLGLASAMLGNVGDAIRYFCAANPAEGLLWTAQQLYQGGHMAASTAVYRYLTLAPTSVDVWQQCAGISYAAEDDETCALAYGVVDARAPERMDGSQLNAWAGVLDNLGEYQACARVALRLSAIAGDDAMLASCGAHHLACALLGMGRAQEALPHAEHAVAINPSPDNAGIFAETAQLCRTDGRRPPMQGRRTTPAGRAQGALSRGDVHAVTELGTDLPWDVRRVVLAASRYRFASENAIRVTPRALTYAAGVLADSEGTTERHACLARASALEVREQAVFPLDRPPGLGGRLEREEVAHVLGDDLDAVRLELGSDRSDEDVRPFDGHAVAALSEFAALMHRIQAGDLPGALAAAGVSLDELGPIGKRWGDLLADDTAMAAQFRRRLAAL